VSFNIFQRYVRNTIANVDSLAHMVLSNVRVEAKKPGAADSAAPPVAARST
jgi:hypothetical protein